MTFQISNNNIFFLIRRVPDPQRIQFADELWSSIHQPNPTYYICTFIAIIPTQPPFNIIIKYDKLKLHAIYNKLQ